MSADDLVHYLCSYPHGPPGPPGSGGRSAEPCSHHPDRPPRANGPELGRPRRPGCRCPRSSCECHLRPLSLACALRHGRRRAQHDRHKRVALHDHVHGEHFVVQLLRRGDGGACVTPVLYVPRILLLAWPLPYFRTPTHRCCPTDCDVSQISLSSPPLPLLSPPPFTGDHFTTHKHTHR